jgi:enamine deaminase RidA (YjgF/YER057c/UK114 family)
MSSDPPAARVRIYRQPAATLYVTQAGQGQAYLVAAGRQGHDAASSTAAAYGQITQALEENNLEIVQERIFGSLEAWPVVRAVRERVCQSRGLNPEGPLTYVQGRPPWGEGLSGVIIRAVARGAPIWTIEHGGRPVGRGWQRHGHTYLILQNLQGLDPGAGRGTPPILQARLLLERAAAILEQQGSTYQDTVRTWFYLQDILAWYRDFNKVRTAAYEKFGLLPGAKSSSFLLPASTGISGEVPTGAMAVMDLLAVIGPEGSRSAVRQLSNPGQQDPSQYGSAFSRGILIRQPDVSRIQVSGTAAIDPRGDSLYPHDLRAQIDCTWEKIANLIGQEGASLAAVSAACIFLKRPEYLQTYQERATAWGLQDLPAVVMVADICRQELLFEMDAEVEGTATNRVKPGLPPPADS